MQRYWFKQKRYGLGAYPSSWQGWALVGAYVAVIAALGIWYTRDAPQIDEERIAPFLALTGVATILLVGISWRTTEGGWRWRWGDKD